MAGVDQFAGASFSTRKGCGFNSRSGHIPRLGVQSPVGVCMRGNQLMLFSHINDSLSQINKHILAIGFKEKVGSIRS